MISLQSLGDAYERRARLAPAVAVAAPALFYLVLVPTSPLIGLFPLLGAAGLLIWAADIVRTRGRATEARLVVAWNGMPTTRALRRSGPAAGRNERRHRRKQLERLLQRRLPSGTDEADDPVAADRAYVEAVRTALNLTRQRDEGELLRAENRNYGFRRNLRGLRTIGMTVLAGALLLDAVLLITIDSTLILLLITAGHLVLLTAWLLIVRDSWVEEQADSFTEQFFITVSTLELSAS